MVKWSEERGRNTKSNREGKESEEIIYGGGNRPSGLFEIQLFTSSTHIMIERQAPSLFFFKRPALSTGPATTLVPRIDRWIDGWIDRWGEYINNRWEEAIQVFRGQREEIHPHTRPCAKKACTFYRDYRFCIYPSKQGAVKRDSSDTCDCQIRGIGRWSLSLSLSLFSPFSFFRHLTILVPEHAIYALSGGLSRHGSRTKVFARFSRIDVISLYR